MVDTGICKAFTLVQVRGPRYHDNAYPPYGGRTQKYGHYHTPLRPGSNFCWNMRPLFFFSSTVSTVQRVPSLKGNKTAPPISCPNIEILFDCQDNFGRKYRGCGRSLSLFSVLFRYSPGLLGSGLRRGCIRPLTSQIERLRVIIAIVHQLLFEARSAN
jgi:hypothetical protein